MLVPSVIDKVLIKAVAKRKINLCMNRFTCVMRLIKKQLCDDVIAWEEFNHNILHCYYIPSSI